MSIGYMELYHSEHAKASSLSAELRRTGEKLDAANRELAELRDQIRVAEAVRDDARRAGQRYLEEKRAAEAELAALRAAK